MLTRSVQDANILSYVVTPGNKPVIDGFHLLWFSNIYEISYWEVYRKVITSVYWDCKVVMMADFLDKDGKMSGNFYSTWLITLWEKIMERRHGKLSRAVLLFWTMPPNTNGMLLCKELLIQVTNSLNIHPIQEMWFSLTASLYTTEEKVNRL